MAIVDGGHFVQWNQSRGYLGFLYNDQTMKVTEFNWANDSPKSVFIQVTFSGQSASRTLLPGTTGSITPPAGLVAVAPDDDGLIFPVGLGVVTRYPA